MKYQSRTFTKTLQFFIFKFISYINTQTQKHSQNIMKQNGFDKNKTFTL